MLTSSDFSEKGQSFEDMKHALKEKIEHVEQVKTQLEIRIRFSQCPYSLALFVRCPGILPCSLSFTGFLPCLYTTFVFNAQISNLTDPTSPKKRYADIRRAASLLNKGSCLIILQ